VDADRESHSGGCVSFDERRARSPRRWPDRGHEHSDDTRPRRACDDLVDVLGECRQIEVAMGVDHGRGGERSGRIGSWLSSWFAS
jgi:hypothetical protein